MNDNYTSISNETMQMLTIETQNRYRFISPIGQGSYGIVVAAECVATGQRVAVKRVERTFHSIGDGKRILREIKILSRLRHDNITNLIDVSCLPDFGEFSALIVVVDLMESDLARVIRDNPNLQPSHHSYFLYQVFRGLKYIHSANVLHRDLKPSNLLVNSDCDLKICDFGLARVANSQDKTELLSEYVETRWYRAPEILLNYPHYSTPIDVWSVGCILAEMMLHRPLFPGKNTFDQLIQISELLGTPTEEDLNGCTNPKALEYMRSLEQRPGIPFAKAFPTFPPDEVDLLQKILTWDPLKRITVDEALEHQFFVNLHDPDDEPVACPLEDFEFENGEISMRDLKILLWNEVIKRHHEFVK